MTVTPESKEYHLSNTFSQFFGEMFFRLLGKRDTEIFALLRIDSTVTTYIQSELLRRGLMMESELINGWLRRHGCKVLSHPHPSFILMLIIQLKDF